MTCPRAAMPSFDASVALLSIALALAGALLVPARPFGAHADPTASPLGKPVIAVDAEGNLHINTTRANTTVYVNGKKAEEKCPGTVPDETVAALVSQLAAYSAELNQLKCAVRRFSPQIVLAANAHGTRSVFSADINGDGGMDVIVTSYRDNRIAWLENEGARGIFSQERLISSSATGVESVFAADLDGDGDLDILSALAVADTVAWYENVDGNGTFSAQRTITTRTHRCRSVYAADLDGDGDLDVLSASSLGNEVAWYENTDGRGTFSQQRIITDSAEGAYSVVASDVDGDGDMDVVSASFQDNTVAWYENVDGAGAFQPRVISGTADGPISVLAADIDGDGDSDVVSASINDGRVVWYDNLDGTGTFSSQKVISTSALYALSVFTADLDGDGDVDVLSASADDNKIAWYENEDGRGTFSEQKVITTTALYAHSVFAADLDADGDLDVLSASANDDTVAWYQNNC